MASPFTLAGAQDPSAVPAAIRGLGRAWGLRPALVGPGQLDACRALLHRVYFGEQGWVPRAGNPSGLRVEGEPPRLVDDYDAEAIWLGVFQGERLVATTRVLLPDPARPLEVTRYQPLPGELLAGAMEVNRIAIERDARRGGALPLVALMLAWVARAHGARRALIAVQAPIAEAVFKRYGWRPTGIAFRYAETDPHPCELLTLESSGAGLVAALARTVGSRLTRRRRR